MPSRGTEQRSQWQRLHGICGLVNHQRGSIRTANLVHFFGRCLTGVDSRSKGAPEFVAIDEQPYDEIVHALRLGEAQRTTHEPFDPGPQVDVLALDFLCVLLAHLILLRVETPLAGATAV